MIKLKNTKVMSLLHIMIQMKWLHFPNFMKNDQMM